MVRSGQAWSGQVRSGLVRSGQARVRSGQVRSGQVIVGCTERQRRFGWLITAATCFKGKELFNKYAW